MAKLCASGALSVGDAFRHWQDDNFIVAHCGIHAGASVGCNEIDLLFPYNAGDRKSNRGVEKAYGLL